MIRIDRVHKTFHGRDGAAIEALRDVSLGVAEGEFVAIVGASGCGKSTLLRLVAGLVSPTHGHVVLDGTEVAAPREETAMVFQAPTLLPWADVLRNVTFPLRLMRRVAPDTDDEARALLATAGLAGFEERLPRELSGGMQQRVAICRALLQQACQRADAVCFVRTPGKHLAHDSRLGLLDANTRRIARAVWIHPVAERRSGPRQHQSRLQLALAATPHPLGNQRALILRDRAADLQQQLVVRILAHGAVEKRTSQPWPCSSSSSRT